MNVSKIKNILIIGMSHSWSLINAATQNRNRFNGEHIQFKNEDFIEYDYEKYLDFQVDHKLAFTELDAALLSIFGNEHNSFGLFEKQVPFSLFNKTCDFNASDNPTRRHFVPREMLKQQMKLILEKRNTFLILNALKKQFLTKPCYFICTPPPIADENHILKFENYYPGRPTNQIAPRQLRLECYRLHCEILAEACDLIDMPFLQSPVEAADTDGFLKETYWQDDPIHANSKYGQLVLSQIERLL